MNPLSLTAHALVIALGLASVGVGVPLLLLPGRAETQRTAAVIDGLHDAPEERVFAVVAGIDYDSGVVVLDSAMGQLVTVVTSAQLHALHIGDLVVVQLNREEHHKKRQQAKEPEETLLL
jgi:hypothetical protein